MTTSYIRSLLAILVILAVASLPASAQDLRPAESAVAPVLIDEPLPAVLARAAAAQSKPNEIDRTRRDAFIERIVLQRQLLRLQQEVQLIEPQQVQQAEWIDIDVVADDKPEANAPRMKISGAFFDSYLFGRSSSLELWLLNNEQDLNVKLIEIQRQHRLSPEEVAKLKLVAKGDLKRLLDQIHFARNEFDRQHQEDENVRPLIQSLPNLRDSLDQGLYSADSLFEKTLCRIRNQKATRARSSKEAGI